MKKIFLIDANNIFYAAYHSYQRLTHMGESVACIYGFPSMIKSIIKQHQPHDVVLCWDGQKSVHRLRLNMDYKAKRKNKEYKDDVYKQKPPVIEIMNYLGIKQVYNKNIEGDDHLYIAYKKFINDKKNYVTIVSTDKDFHQLIKKRRADIWNPKQKFFLNQSNFFKLNGYHHTQSVDYISLVGDTSDNIKGYHGIGEVKAKIFLRELNSIPEFIASTHEFKGIIKEELNTLYEKNKTLIDLRVFYKKYIKGKNELTYFMTDKPEFREKSFIMLCDKYNLKTLKTKSFIETFKKFNHERH